MKVENCYLDKFCQVFMFLFVMVFLFISTTKTNIAYAKTCGPSGSGCSSDDCLSNCEGPDERKEVITCLLTACDYVSTCDQILTKSEDLIKKGLLTKETKDSNGRTFLEAFYLATEEMRLYLLNYHEIDIKQEPYNKTACYLTSVDKQNALSQKKQPHVLSKPVIHNTYIPGGFGCTPDPADPSKCKCDLIDPADPSKGCKDLNIAAFIKVLIPATSAILGGLAILKIIMSGIMYATAMGNTEQLSNAKSHITYAIIGLVLIIGMNMLLAILGAYPL